MNPATLSNSSAHISAHDEENQIDQVPVGMSHVDPTTIVLQDVDYTIGDKQILHNLNLAFVPGKLSVIVGPSGSGKTSLLSLIAGIQGGVPTNAKRTGKILMNGEEVSAEKIRKIVGFVFQDDVILETMTVEEAIALSIKLRVGNLTKGQVSAMLERMIEVSQLDRARTVKIGSPMRKGISGGERKRTSIAMELVSNPSVLLLDEPTSGLDTYTAYRIMALLKRLAHKYGRTVITTLHQPSSEIYHMIDDLFVLHEGQVVYGGPAKDIVPYFSAFGYSFPEYSNPLDVLFMDVLNRSKEDEFAEYLTTPLSHDDQVPLELLPQKYADSPQYQQYIAPYVEDPSGTGVTKAMHRFRAKSLISLWILLLRDLKNVMRNPMIVKTKFLQTLFLAAFISVVFWKTGDSPVPALYQNISGVIFFLITNAYFASFQNVLPVFFSEKASFSREHSQGYFPMTSYFLAKIIVELPLTVFFPIITASAVYWAAGLRYSVGRFLLFTLILQLVSLTGFSFGLFAACLFNDLSVALALSILILLPFMIFSGLLLNIDTVPVWLRWIQWVSPMRYGFSALMENQFSGWEKPGSDAYYRNSGVSTGLSLIGNILVLVALFASALFGAYLALSRVVFNNEGGRIRDLPKKGLRKVSRVIDKRKGSEKVNENQVEMIQVPEHQLQ